MAKRTYTEAQAMATNKYRAKTYRMINVKLRLDEDAEIIKSLEDSQKSGKSYREWLQELYYKK